MRRQPHVSGQGFIADKRLLGSKSGGTADMTVRPDKKRYGWMVFLFIRLFRDSGKKIIASDQQISSKKEKLYEHTKYVS